MKDVHILNKRDAATQNLIYSGMSKVSAESLQSVTQGEFMRRQRANRLAVYAKRWIYRILMRKKKQEHINVDLEEEESLNPYLFQIREIIEQILEKRNISYEVFSPVMIDGKDSEATLMAAELLAEDLNHLTILTDQPAYFENYADNMYEERGLLVEIFPKNLPKTADFSSDELQGNVILDFEKPKENSFRIKFGKKLYIPVFKKAWEPAGNLDIAVPIGYNTVIVKGKKTEKEISYFDKFERAFYGNEIIE